MDAVEFRFNFGGAAVAKDNDDETKDETAQSRGDEGGAGEENNTPRVPAREVLAEEGADWQSVCMEEVRFACGLMLLKGRVDSPAAVLGQDLSATDLVPGVYEGGFKLWECAIDLINVLHKRAADEPIRAQRVIELGCGHGLPGIAAMRLGAGEVQFQDYNEDVLTALTIPNTRANMNEKEATNTTSTARFFAGDWADMPPLLGLTGNGNHDKKYDIVLSSETIYSEHAQRRLYDLILKCLRRPHGYALIAAKSYYFGVGGGTQQFRSMVEAEGVFMVKCGAKFSDGVSNMREVLELTFKQND